MRSWIPVLALSLSGCYLVHGLEARPLDGGRRPDAARRDAGREGRDAGPLRRDASVRVGDYWTLERREAQLAIPHEIGCTQHEGGRIALTVRALISNECEHAGPVETTLADDGTLVVTAYLWVQHRRDPDDCLGVTAISERTLLIEAQEGTFRAVTDDGGSSVEYRVGAIDDLPCTFGGARDAPCLLDCQCQAGLACIPTLGDFVACDGGICGDPCQLPSTSLRPIYAQHLECDVSEQCRFGPGAAAPRCQPIEGDGCDPAGDGCGPGLVCPPTGEATECTWEAVLSAETRHACTDDPECDDGLFCVEHPDGERRCEVPCFTDRMRCPFMHECSPTSHVCEWIGE